MLTDDMRMTLVKAASDVRINAYVPYSNYAVGAAVLTSSGKVFTGVNVENAAYPSAMCAERVAIFKAISEGEKQFEAISVVTENGGTPCGACRQVMAEFGLQTVVLIANQRGEIVRETDVGSLLPDAFLPGDLIDF
jgi:cytidine deaminase